MLVCHTCRLHLIPAKQEPSTCAQGLKATVKNLLLAFYRANRKYKPERLVFYRDGVSEGQVRSS